MEQSDHFISVISFKKELEQQLEKCSETSQRITQESGDVTRVIEEHFAKWLSILATRKATLLKEVESKLDQQKAQLAESKALLEKSIEGCEDILKAGSSVYNVSKNGAKNIWKEAKQLPIPKLVVGTISVNLPDFFGSMQSYGTVNITTEPTASSIVLNKTNALKEGEHQTQTSLTTNLPKNQPTIYYDMLGAKVGGLRSYIVHKFPTAVNYTQNTLSPCVILTFIVVNALIDVNNYISVCNERMVKSDGMHFVVVIFKRLVFIPYSIDPFTQLPCKALYSAEYDGFWNMFTRKSADIAVASINYFLQKSM